MYGFNGASPGFAASPSPDEEWDDFPGSPGGSRRPAIRGRTTGKIVEWKGKFGWLQPDAPIDHPEARMKGGRIYLSQEDVAEVISGVGAHVSFYVYADGTGLGAMMCVPSDSPLASAPLQKKAKPKTTPRPKPKATPGRKRLNEAPLLGKVKSWNGRFGFITPSDPVEHPLFTGSLFLHTNDVATELVEAGKRVSFFLYADPQGLGAEECTIIEDGAASPPPKAAADAPEASSTLLKARPKASGGAPGEALATLMAPRAKGAPMKARPKAAAAVASDPELASKMAAKPELARRLSAWMFDPGG
mmetsp:Transcript_43475/g.131499  ORF Transcript_43475/g.131499 Transcript_43475/m.131499 type:complete len:303 (-) Transcript_43475:25-933(-)